MRRPSRSLPVVALLLLAGTAAAASQPSAAVAPDCTVRLLASLGWQLEHADVDEPRLHGGQPCERADLADAWAHGDLRLQLPAQGRSLAERPQLLQTLLEHPATRCAYLFRLGSATRRAVDRLVANPGYRFSAVQRGWIGFGFGGPTIDGWRQTVSFGRAFVPATGNWRAIEGFYEGRVRAECGVGRQVAQYAAQAELYGPQGFDREFDAGEIVIGRFTRLHPTASILLGSGAGELVADGLAQKAAEQGRQALGGLPGFIVHSFDRAYLDDIHNQAQNFVIYSASPAAVAALRRHGGFARTNQMARELWTLAAQLPRRGFPAGHRQFERLLADRDPARRAGLDRQALSVVERIDRLLDDPVFGGIEIYVHPHGVRPIGWHFVRMLDRNPRTPYRIELALHNLHTTLYQRYLAHRLRECVQQRRGMPLIGSVRGPATTD